ENYLRSVDGHVCVHRVGSKLATDEGLKSDTLPSFLAQQSVGSRHGVDAPIERSERLGNGAAAVTRKHRDHSHTSEHIFDAVVELSHQQFFACLGTLSLRNISD